MASDLINPSEYMTETSEVDQLKARIERLERFIVQGYDWPAMLTESNLSDTIRHTVDHNMWVDISATLRGGNDYE